MSDEAKLDVKTKDTADTMADDFDFLEGDSESQSVSQDLLKEMIKAGLWYGKRKSKTNPKMRYSIFAQRNGIEIIDLAKTAVALEKALAFLGEVAARGEKILFVGTQPAAKVKIKELAEKFNQPYVTNRWLGGTLTNFQTLSKRIDHFKKLKADKASGALGKYTKKEQLNFTKEIERLHTLFSGVENMERVPGAVFLINSNIHETALREAIIKKIPVVAVINTDTNPDRIQYPIVANESSMTSVNWILEKVEEVLKKSATSQPKTEPKA